MSGFNVGPEEQVPPCEGHPTYKATLALLKWWPYKRGKMKKKGVKVEKAQNRRTQKTRCADPKQGPGQRRRRLSLSVVRPSLRSSPNELYLESAAHLGPSIPVVLVKGILDRHDRVLLDEAVVHVQQLV